MPSSLAAGFPNNLNPGDHLCWFYDSDLELWDLLPLLLKRGLEQGDKVVYIVDTTTPDAILERLRSAGIEVDQDAESGRFSISTSGETFLRSGGFDPDSMVEFLRTETDRAIEEGHRALRVISEMTWVLKVAAEPQRVVEYEAKVGHALTTAKCIPICLYDQRRFDPELLLEILHSHPMLILHKTPYANACHLPPLDVLGDDVQRAKLDHCLRNIVDRTGHEEEFRDAEERFRAMAEATFEGVIIHESGRIIAANKTLVKMFGYEFGELVGSLIFDLFEQEYRGILERNIATGYEQPYEAVGKRKDKSPVMVEIRGKPLRFRGKLVRVAAIRDVSERREFEEELKRKNAELRAALSVKEEFLSMVSHELRAPLVPIMGYSELLLDGTMGEMPESAKDALNTINDRAEALSALIDDLLLLSGMERGALRINSGPLRPHETVLDLIASYRDVHQGKPVTIEWHGEECAIMADSVRFRQILQNLIRNAIKYSGDSAHISIQISTADGLCAIAVSDNGIGISKDHLPRVFERFYQVEQIDTRSRKGTGLGLTIAKELVELMGGSIEVESEPGKGSTFTVTLPLAVESAMQSSDFHDIPLEAESAKRFDPAAIPDQDHRLRILVVDDDRFTQQLLAIMLGGSYEILSAPSAEEGSNLIQMTQVDLILLDWMMPGMDGLSLLLALKADDSTKDIPVIFISGKAEKDAINRALKAGALDFITKPFRRNDLVSRIEKARVLIS